MLLRHVLPARHNAKVESPQNLTVFPPHHAVRPRPSPPVRVFQLRLVEVVNACIVGLVLVSHPCVAFILG